MVFIYKNYFCYFTIQLVTGGLSTAFMMMK